MKEIKLTFVCPCYNHEEYVVDFEQFAGSSKFKLELDY